MTVNVGDELTVVSGNPTSDELAAVISVLQVMAVELSGEHQKVSPHTTAWAASQRPIRSPIVPGHTRWRSFGG